MFSEETWKGIKEWVQAIGGAVILTTVIIVFVAQSFMVQGASMEPTLQNRQRLLVEKVSYRFRDPGRGDVVVFRYPANPSEEFIKRIVALPGDAVTISGGRLFVNGVAVEEDYTKSLAYRDYPEQVVPDDHFFLLGDNRNNSLDSRDRRVGFVARELIVGRAVWSYWPLSELRIIQAPSALANLPEPLQ